MAAMDPVTAGLTLVDDIGKELADFFDPTKKAEAQAKIDQIKEGAALERFRGQIAVIVAEAQSGSWLTRSWRPITMLTFLGLVVSWWFGWTPPRASDALVSELFTIIKIGLGGYTVGRSAEKVAGTVAAVMKK